MKLNHPDVQIPLIVLGATAAVLVAFWALSSYEEARAFTRITGKPVTTWDAMWTDLRVQERVREDVREVAR